MQPLLNVNETAQSAWNTYAANPDEVHTMVARAFGHNVKGVVRKVAHDRGVPACNSPEVTEFLNNSSSQSRFLRRLVNRAPSLM